MTPMEALQTALIQLEQAQGKTQQQLDALTVQIHGCCNRVDAFVAAVQQDSTYHSEHIARLDSVAERLESVLAYLVRWDDRQRG
ncbi:hypothetical protein NDI45_25190 [Leptolyngbya sp. GB1-A1]|uniref:hypothetical protein n=1 Tax=Leptolyngbya sp. GB1-A1 TaxID=2933908 RepID=UPI003297C561